MKLKEAIDIVDRLKPNNIDEPDKIRAISELDGLIHQDIYSKASDYIDLFTPYKSGDEEKTLLIPFPYDDMYINYLSAKVDFLSGEIASYNNNMTLYNTSCDNFAAYYRRNHIPK